MSYNLIGKDFTPPDIVAKVTGKAKYSEDFRVEGMVFCRLLTSPMPHAKVKSIDASEALTSLAHTPGDLNVGVFNDGSIGAENVGFSGTGVTWKGRNGLFVGGLVFGTSGAGSANGLIGSFGITGDLVNVASKFSAGFTSDGNFDQKSAAVLSDAGAPAPYDVAQAVSPAAIS